MNKDYFEVLSRKTIESYSDGTWIETDADMTKILCTWPPTVDRPEESVGAVYLWRRKQLLDQLK